MPFDKVECGQRVMEARILRGLLVNELGHAVGIGPRVVCDIEAGRRIPSLLVAIKLADILHVDLEWLCCQQNMMRRADCIDW